MPEHSPHVPLPTTAGFAGLGVPAPLIEVLVAGGITEPFPIQSATLPDSLSGRDVLGRGRTGSGKTVAFCLPTIAALSGSGRSRRPGAPRALILVPTRELANQVAATITPMARAFGMRTLTILGGVGQGAQVRALTAGVDVCIATPGRLEDLIRQGHCRLSEVEVTVIDEADHMSDLGFLPAVKRLLDATPKGTQRLLFSATLDNAVDVLVRRYLHHPVSHAVDGGHEAAPDIDHHVFTVHAADKAAVVRELVGGQGRTLAFTRTKHAAKKLASQLTAAGIPAVDLHGNLSQNARERNLAAFGRGDVRVLVATDIAARGIHVDGVTLVIHVDPPAEHKAYLHRSGRTARAGESGTVVTIGTPDQRRDIETLMKRASIRAEARRIAPGDAAITGLVGPPAPTVAPAAPAREQERTSSGAGRPRTRGSRARTKGAKTGTTSAARATSRGTGAASATAVAARTGSGAHSAATFSAGRRRGR